jgi:WD40-like Beta Propeller Repeat
VRAAFLCIALAAPVLAAAPARADIFAVAPVVAPGRTDVDVGLFNVSTGAQLALPAGVNTPAEENHPSISADGRRLAFERRDGADRIVVADLTTAQTSDVYDAFDAATKQPTSPAISGDGKTVVTGSRSQGVFWTPLSTFPNPPDQRFGEAFFQGSPVLDPTPTNGTPGSLIAFRVSTRMLRIR